MKKSNFVSSRKQSMVPLDKDKGGIAMEICKTKAIQTDLGIFWHILTYSGISRRIQDIFGNIQAYLEPLVTMAYLESWYIQNEKHIHSRYIIRTLVYSFRNLSNIYEKAITR